ncbi:MAG: MFS transporter [Chloroflexi bacterium OHK40]
MDKLTSTTRRITTTLFVTQSLASAGYIAIIAVNAIIGAELSGNAALAGLPSTLMLGGATAVAYPAGRFMQRFGRRPGLALGFFAGMVGMLVNGASVVWDSFGLFLLGLLILGMARGTTDQSRYAAADAVPMSQRARAISTVVLAGTVGAVCGPALVGPLSQFARALGLAELSGPMFGSSALFALGGLLILLLLHPDPHTLAIQRGTDVGPAAQPTVGGSSMIVVLRQPLARVALASMAFGQLVMVLVMSVTSLHMHHHNHGLGDISLVISAHTLGMFGLSAVSGILADRIFRPLATVLGALLLIAGSLVAPLSLLTPWLALALFLIGLGWNFCYIAGSSLLADALEPSERGRIQGASELLVNLASASGSFCSGFVLASFSYGWLCTLGALIALALLLTTLVQTRQPQPHPIEV